MQTGGARPEIDPQGGRAITQQGWFPSLVSQPSFDSVSAPATMLGVRVPEYIVYEPTQAVPRFILAVEEVGR